VSTSTDHFDVLVVGGGNAGFCAAHAAAEQGARVLLLEKAPEDQAGGNTFYTAGAFRIAFDSLDDLVDLLDDETRARLDETDVPPYPAAAFLDDMRRLTEGRNDPVLTDVLVGRSLDTVRWMAGKGVQWRLMYERQAYRTEGRWRFWGGLYLGTVDGGKGLYRDHLAAARAAGVDVRFDAAVTALHRGDDGPRGVSYGDGAGVSHRVAADAVVLAAGGFEADAGRRARHLGEEWGAAFVRGCPTNTGEVLDLALAAGADRAGDWASCHSVAWDSGADPAGGDRELTNQRTRQSYPLGIVVNADGRRFVDEGADFRNYTYAKYGREILRQPGGRAFQVFDAKTRPLLRHEEYDSSPITVATAETLDKLAAELGIDAAGLAATVAGFNAAIEDVPFDPAVKDGRAARVDPPKSNWAQAIDTPPYWGYAVGCGITFTFGGLRVDPTARVLDHDGRPLEGLYAAGELVGGLFSGNYPGGTGLTSGSVFGRLAGEGAAAVARGR
jgi:tricarballylate dehydrogenase